MRCEEVLRHRLEIEIARIAPAYVRPGEREWQGLHAAPGNEALKL